MNDTINFMIKSANEVRSKAYAPISKFPVGSCIRTPDNQFYTGCNVENASFSMTICAESSAVANMVSGGHRKIAEIVVISSVVPECPPCGACRQRIYEFSDCNTLVHLCSKEGLLLSSFKIQELLCQAFSIDHVKYLYEIN